MKAARTEFCCHFNLGHHDSVQHIQSAYKFERTDSVTKRKPPSGVQTIRTSNNIDTSRAAVIRRAQLSIRCHAVYLQLNSSIIQILLIQNLHYKLAFTLQVLGETQRSANVIIII